jgi:hypothetical protein
MTSLTGMLKSSLNLSEDDWDELLQASNGKVCHMVMQPRLRYRKLFTKGRKLDE